MKKNKSKNREILFLVYLKRLIFITFIILEIFPLNTNANPLNNEKKKKIIKFKINGNIIITDKKNNNIIDTIQLNTAIINTKINETNINFKDNNILPTQNGELNYIDPYQHITLLDISLEEFIINSPMIIKEYPNFLFISNRTMSLFSININNGSINYMKNNIKNNNDFRYIRNICPKNKDDILFLRFDYYLQMKYSYIYDKNKYKFDDLIWQSHYVKIIPIYPKVNIELNNNFNDYNNFENEDYYIFEINDDKNINMIYSQDKDICCQIKDVQNDYFFNNNYYFGNNKRKYLFDYNIIKKDEKKRNLSFIFLKKLFSLIIIIALSTFILRFLKELAKKNNNKKNIWSNFNKINIKENPSPLKIENNENNKQFIDVKPETQNEKLKTLKSKSISNLSTICSIRNENIIKIFENEEDDKKICLINKARINNSKGKNNSGKKRDIKYSSSRLSVQKKRFSHKRRASIKQLSKDLKKYSAEEKIELHNLFKTYISDINNNTLDSNINLNVNNLSENEDKYKQIYSLIKSEDSSSSEEIYIDEKKQGFYQGELENNFLFYFDNGRLLKCYKDFQFIGKGGFGVVFKATNRIDESQWAIKIMKINLDLKEENEDLKVTQEIKTMLKFKNKNIVRYKTCWFEFNQKRIKKNRRQRAMSLEQRNAPTIDFKNDYLEEGEKNIKNRLKKHLKTPLERIQSISKELKLAEKQKDTHIVKARKQSIIWGDDEESDMDSLGANKNYAIKEEGEDKYILLDDKENNEINDSNNNINSNENEDNFSYDEDNSNESDISDDNGDGDDDDDNQIDFGNLNKENNADEKDNDIVFYDSSKKDESSNNKNKRINDKINEKENKKEDKVDKENEYEDEYENLGHKNDKNYNESLSKNNENENTYSNELLNIEKDSENNSIFEEEIKREKEEEKKKDINENSIDDDESDDLKNNSEDGLGVSKQNKNRKKKKYPIYFFIQMEYCSGCPMNYYLSHRSAVPSKKLTTYMLYQMCKAVKHIHDENIIHRDLKPGNIFIIDDYLIKIGDFGLALNSEKIQEKQGGTYLYQSPEQINNQPYDEKIDIFALGVILVELVSKFNTEFERREILYGLKKSCYPEYLKKDHLKEYNLVVKMTRLNPKERPNIREILKDNDFNDLINESLNSDK